MKKQWISVKCGLSRDAKHRQEMGECIWLYLHILDTATWEDGTVHEWKDEAIAMEMDMPVRTVRDQRQKLAESGYITCNRKKHSQDVIIHNWTNPREYSGRITNTRIKSDTLETIPVFESNTAMSLSNTKSDTESDTKSDTRSVTPTSYSNNQRSNAGGGYPIPNVRSAQSDTLETTPDFLSLSVRQAKELPTLKMFEKCTNFFPGQILWEYVHNFIMENGITEEKLKDTAIEWVSRGYRTNNVKGILEVAAFGFKNGERSSTQPAHEALKTARQYIKEQSMIKPGKNTDSLRKIAQAALSEAAERRKNESAKQNHNRKRA